jgi:hypothetical protein
MRFIGFFKLFYYVDLGDPLCVLSGSLCNKRNQELTLRITEAPQRG